MQRSIEQAQVDASIRRQHSRLSAYIAADNIPYYGLNEECVVESPKKKELTIYDLARLVFPDDPIRDYVEKKVAEIEERYRWIDEFY